MFIVVIALSLISFWAELPCAGAVLTVTSTNNTGPGSLRDLLDNAYPGDTAQFSSLVFRTNTPATIFLSNSLSIYQGGITVDGSDAGVILDGSRVGTVPEATLIDDVRLRFNGGTNLLANGDFSAGLAHWCSSDETPRVQRRLNPTNFVSTPASLEISSRAHDLNANTFYDSASRSIAYADWPANDPASGIWISSAAGQTVALDFRVKSPGGGTAFILLLHGDGWWENLADNSFAGTGGDWQVVNLAAVVPSGGVAVAVQITTYHSQRWEPGLWLASSSNVIRGLQLVGFPGQGVVVWDVANNVIGGNRLLGSGPLGQGNLISGSGNCGVLLAQPGASNNIIAGNFIGTGLGGRVAMGNLYGGVVIQQGSSSNRVGGVNLGEGNVISGNGGDGVNFQEAHNNWVVGNLVGTDATGTNALGNANNGGNGVSISGGSTNNTIGGSTAGARNVISGNGDPDHWADGVRIFDSNTARNRISGNYIGLDATGTIPLANHGHGIDFESGANENVIGGQTTGEANLISGNSGGGILCFGADVRRNTFSRSSVFQNGQNAIQLLDGANDRIAPPRLVSSTTNSVSGTTGPGFKIEVFSGVADEGEHYEGSVLADGLGNFTYTQPGRFANPRITATATDPLGNTSQFGHINLVTSTNNSGPGSLRDLLDQALPGDTLRFSTEVFRTNAPATIFLNDSLNIIQGGITIDGSDAGVMLDGSRVGTLAEVTLIDDVRLRFNSGSNVLANGDFSAGLGHWCRFDDTSRVQRRINTTDAVSPPASLEIPSLAHDFNANTFYDSASLSMAYANWPANDPASGIWISAMAGQTVSLDFWLKSPGAGTAFILLLHREGWWENLAVYSFPGTSTNWQAVNLTATVPPGGVAVAVQINTFHSQRYSPGLWLGSSSNTIRGLQIVGFPGQGVMVWDGANNVIGGSRLLGTGPLGQGNVISGNGHFGIECAQPGASNNIISGNFIGADLTGQMTMGNFSGGIMIQQDSSSNRVGGTNPGEGNLISGNGSDGINLFGTRHNRIVGNLIGGTIGSSPLGNASAGIRLDNASGNAIGGTNTGEANVISGNGASGILAQGATAARNRVSRNSIFENGDAGIKLLDGANAGILPPSLCGARSNSIAGSTQPGYKVEIFSDNGDEGRYYQGTANADASGRFAYTTPGTFTGSQVTATATDLDGNTSAFSAVLPNDPPAIVLMTPPPGYRLTSTHTLVAATFSASIDPGTVTPLTFLLREGAEPVPGTVDYVSASKMAVFRPFAPLASNKTYMATITTGVANCAGQSPTSNVTWSFSTAGGPGPMVGGMRILFGDLHSHTSYSDGTGTPADAFATARANGLDFFAVTDHSSSLTAAEWQDMRTQATNATVDGEFVGLRGFEFTHPEGHINVFATDTYVTETDDRYNTLPKFYDWLAAQPQGIGQFNHPFPGWNFDDFSYRESAGEKLCLMESGYPPDVQRGLSNQAGWHAAITDNSDTHSPDWGSRKYMGIIASNLTGESVLEAIRARRVFTMNDKGYGVVMQANGHWMGSVVPYTGTLDFTVSIFSRDPAVAILLLVLYDNGVPVAADAPLSYEPAYTWQTSLSAQPGHYYYVKAMHDSEPYSSGVITGPIWVSDAAPVRPVLLPTLSGGHLTLSWSASAIGYVVETVSRLAPTNTWEQVTNAAVIANGRFSVVLNWQATNHFFRLRASSSSQSGLASDP